MNDGGADPAGGGNMRSDLMVSVGTILKVLRAVGDGDLSQRLELDFPETHPVGALAATINTMVGALGEAQSVASTYLQEVSTQIDTIERQREAIRNLSIPIIEVWAGVLCVPIVGILDSVRAADVTTSLLAGIVQKKARFAIIDVTGIEVMDTQSADHFLRMARAVSLLGAQCALSGVHPNIARTIVHMGVELQGLKCYRTMREALRFCVRHNDKTRAASPKPNGKGK
ncbi:MAG TPA: STAS domain-containing protein [Polyangiaceae bacterium]|nr:STAS domain-containing protein [Polyangiaceae bacterium]